MNKRLGLALALLAWVPSCAAEGWFLRSGDPQGVFLRVAYASIPTPSLEHSVGGKTEELWAGVPMRLWIGHSVAPRWIIHASILDVMVQLTESDENASAMVWALGATRYFEQGNLFLSGQVGFSPFIPPSGSGTKGGYLWTIAVGKEIQVSKNNGIGAMATYDGGSWKDPDTDETWSL